MEKQAKKAKNGVCSNQTKIKLSHQPSHKVSANKIFTLNSSEIIELFYIQFYDFFTILIQCCKHFLQKKIYVILECEGGLKLPNIKAPACPYLELNLYKYLMEFLCLLHSSSVFPSIT